ncbi:hypothetical protein D9611_010108 [Ephemerocybe angulata]|uniref:FAD-binding PCMH-type domain-containing protein n=1 Tax=Ephemerocybe angulata TaxID=980116 RepID=A0A8H5AZ81_9AGAR|nr:hypothetical protein D9611_010108 [Tulosesus angulatus]
MKSKILIIFGALSSGLFSISLAQDGDISFAESDIAVASSNIITKPGGQKYACKTYPGDKSYPVASAWAHFNETVGGNLQVAIPPGAECYQTLDGVIQTFDAAKCAEVRANWADEQWNTDHPISNLWPYWTNGTCTPFPADSSSTCTRGFYGDYVVTAKTRAHIKSTIDFARRNNLRLIIRNTGHDFMGRSTGWGSLILNTHSFKDVTFTKKYTGPGTWRGGAATVGAGIQGRELARLANKQSPPQVIVMGECPTVGFAGGFIQGGGHGPLATLYGMAADQVLSVDVVTASGKFVTANAASNPDLFWALKGGGPSTFAALISVTVKTYNDLPSAAVILNINFTHTTDLDVYWKGVDAFHSLANRYVENGLFVYYELLPLRLHVQPFVGPNKTAAELGAVVKPLFDKLDAEGVPYSTETKEFKAYFDLYIDVFEDETSGSPAITGGRLYTRKDIAENATAINDAQRFSIEQGAFIVGHIVGPGTGAPKVDNAINPKWREAASFSITSFTVQPNATLAEKAEAQRVVTHVAGQKLREASPNGAAYVNEGDLEEPNWQHAYWGTNYPRLLKLKKKYDPLGVFYARTTPGTEDWETIDFGTKLCKKL